MPKKSTKSLNRKVKSTRGRKPNIPDEEWVRDYPIVILPMVSSTNRTKVVGYHVYALNLPNLGAVLTRSQNIQAAFSTMRKRINGYLADCRKAKDGKGRPIKPTPPALHGELIPAPYTDALDAANPQTEKRILKRAERLRLFAALESHALHELKAQPEASKTKRGKRSRIQVGRVGWTEWEWGASAEEIEKRFGDKHPREPEPRSEEVKKARRTEEYRAMVLDIYAGDPPQRERPTCTALLEP